MSVIIQDVIGDNQIMIAHLKRFMFVKKKKCEYDKQYDLFDQVNFNN